MKRKRKPQNSLAFHLFTRIASGILWKSPKECSSSPVSGAIPDDNLNRKRRFQSSVFSLPGASCAHSSAHSSVMLSGASCAYWLKISFSFVGLHHPQVWRVSVSFAGSSASRQRSKRMGANQGNCHHVGFVGLSQGGYSSCKFVARPSNPCLMAFLRHEARVAEFSYSS